VSKEEQSILFIAKRLREEDKLSARLFIDINLNGKGK
jgi:hypothetical protein